MFFKKRKSRKQLLKEIEELKAEVIKQQSYKLDVTMKLDQVEKSIKTVKATCISQSDDEKYQAGVKESLCRQLVEEIFPYVSVEKYRTVEESPYYNWFHVASLQIVEK